MKVITGATGTGRGDVKKNLEAILGTHSTDSIQLTAMLGTLQISFELQRWGSL